MDDGRLFEAQPASGEYWLVEKCQQVLWGLAGLHDEFRRRDDLPQDFADGFLFYMAPVLWNVTKILSYACNGKWSSEDRELIVDGGQAALEQLFVRYGLLAMTQDAKERFRQWQLVQRLSEIETCLSGTRHPSRTLLHVLLRKRDVRYPILDRLAELTEKVTMGELSWEEYVPLARRLIEQFRENGPTL